MATERNIDTLGLDYARRFTTAYKLGTKSDLYLREILCEDVQFPAVLVAPRETDLLCGKRVYPEVGYSVQGGGLGYYFDTRSWEGAQPLVAYSKDELVEWNELKAFWDKESTESKCWLDFPNVVRNRLTLKFSNHLEHPGYPLYRMAGLQLNYGKLVTLGIGGLESEMTEAAAKPVDEEAGQFYYCALKSLYRLRRCIEYWLSTVRSLPTTSKAERMVQALAGLLDHAPQTFHEALQLILAVQTITGTNNFGRLDTVLGPILCKGLDSGELQWTEALELMQNFYTIIEEEILHFDGRIIIGGMGRVHEAEADRFAMLAMETTDSLNLPMPQVSLRFYQGQNPELLDKAYEVIGHGKTFPMLYNDDINVPAVEKAFKLDRKTAEQYIPYGCGEYMIDHQSCGTPNFVINLQLCLELAMNNGRCIQTGRQISSDYGYLAKYKNFEELWDAYAHTVDDFHEAGAQAQYSTYQTTGRECPYSLISILYDDCISKGRPIFSGGIRFLGGMNETYGNNNTADSLTAINELIYKRGLYSKDALMMALGVNWKGDENMRLNFINAPKFGNDHDVADAMVERVHRHVCHSTAQAGESTGLHHFLVVIINNNTNTIWGKCTSASADGRFHAEPLAPGNSAGSGCDKNGLTALLNSQSKSDPSIHGGAVQNVKISSSFPAKNRSLYHALFRGYFKRGGAQMMITVTSHKDLLAALKNPEKYANLLVRVGGFSARFVDLDSATQEEILSRTLHDD